MPISIQTAEYLEQQSLHGQVLEMKRAYSYQRLEVI